jgi:phage head maturation protease
MAALTPVLAIEDGGRFFRGLALPFGVQAYVVDRGDIVAEIMDAAAIDRLPSTPLPLFVGHDRAGAAAGVVHTVAVTDRGLGVEGELVGTDAEIEGWHRRFRVGLNNGLSVGFTASAARTRYERPARRGDPPIRRPRGVEVVEVSLVQWPAYDSASVVSLSKRSAADEVRHTETLQIIREWEERKLVMAHERRMREKREKTA